MKHPWGSSLRLVNSLSGIMFCITMYFLCLCLCCIVSPPLYQLCVHVNIFLQSYYLIHFSYKLLIHYGYELDIVCYFEIQKIDGSKYNRFCFLWTVKAWVTKLNVEKFFIFWEKSPHQFCCYKKHTQRNRLRDIGKVNGTLKFYSVMAVLTIEELRIIQKRLWFRN